MEYYQQKNAAQKGSKKLLKQLWQHVRPDLESASAAAMPPAAPARTGRKQLSGQRPTAA